MSKPTSKVTAKQSRGETYDLTLRGLTRGEFLAILNGLRLNADEYGSTVAADVVGYIEGADLPPALRELVRR